MNEMNNRNIKLFGEKLAQYASCKPKQLLQLDGHHKREGVNEGTCHLEVMYELICDSEGDDLYGATSTIELMNGASVRVLIPYETNAKVAARQLKKMAKLLKRNPDLMEFAKPDPEPKPEENICTF